MYRWYVVNTYSGHENKVKQNLEHRVVSLNQKRAVRQVVVPTETVTEMKDNQKIPVEKRTMPGYVLVNMELNDDSWQLVKGTPGVTGFVGASNEPVPLTQPEVDRLLHREVRRRSPPRPSSRSASRSRWSPAAVGLLRRDLRDQPGRAAPEGACVDLRPRDAGRGRLRPSEEDLALWQRKSSPRIKLQAGRWPGVPGPAGRPCPRPARHQHHGVLQGVQRPDAERLGTVIPVVITVYEDRSFTFITKTPPAAVLIRQAAQRREGLGRAAPREGRPHHAGAVARDRREEAARSQRARHRSGGQDHRGHRPLDGRGGGLSDGQARS